MGYFITDQIINHLLTKVLFIFGCGLAGVIFFQMWTRFLLSAERRGAYSQKERLLREAQNQGEALRSQAIAGLEEEFELRTEELNVIVSARQEDLRLEEKQIESREEALTAEQQRIERMEQGLLDKQQKLTETIQTLENLTQQKTHQSQIIIDRLNQTAKVALDEMLLRLQKDTVSKREIECQKVLKGLHDELSSSAQRLAQRFLDRSLARYYPKFVWPKSTNFAEIKDPKIFDFFQTNVDLFQDLEKETGINLTLLPQEKSEGAGGIKVAGGFGINREALRLALSDTRPNQLSLAKIILQYESRKQFLEKQAITLGDEAINILKLPDIHPEIRKLVGALNWRTSYRQNQWYHTVEVAVLAGILAEELGIDPDQAKRVGLLHDIGKAIDYRIEGSHAVISGDYADRYGETRLICDTVMSHHADLIVETPLAYILRAADTLSGARPGARVNIEEGYQIRLSAISDVVHSFTQVVDLAIMNGGREVHIQVDDKKVRENDMKEIAQLIAKKIEEEVAYPGQIKILLTRTFESVSVA